MSDNLEEFTPDDIKSLRVSTDFTQQTFADALGVRKATVSDWERGVSKPSRLARQKLTNFKAVFYGQRKEA